MLGVIEETPPAGVWLVGALFTRTAPRLADSGAAQTLGAHDPGQLTSAHVGLDLREAGSRPFV